MPDNDPSAHPAPVLDTGDIVRVRSVEEILATLDPSGTLDSLPLMPEALKYAGQELRVYKSAHKTCDTINGRGTTRRMDRAVHLTGARCDGSAHDGCQAGCMLFWKEEWLERVDGTPVRETPEGAIPLPLEVVQAGTRAGADEESGETIFRCQATELVRATTYLPVHDTRQYVNDVRTGNVPLRKSAQGLLISVFNNYQKISRRLPSRLRIRDGSFYPFYRGTGTPPLPRPDPLDLKPGELVEVKDKAEIMPTLGPNNRNRGLWFDAEMLPYAGRRGRVLARIEKIINESTGRMLKLKDCVVIEDITCAGQFNRYCPRSDYIYWREAWLRRVDDPSADEAPGM